MTNPTNTGRGGARPGSGRRSGSKAPPSTVVRLPLDLAEAARRAAAARGGQASGIGAFLRGEARSDATAPLMSSTVPCGFPSPAEDHQERPLDLNELHGIGLPSVFLVRVQGESMRDAGMLPGDVAIVDKSREAQSGNVVVACLNGEFTLKCSGAQSKCGRRAIKGDFRRRLGETGGRLRRTFRETGRIIGETDARSSGPTQNA